MTAKYFKSFLLLVPFAFVLACSSDYSNNNNATIEDASRPSDPITLGDVRIGTQVWMARNLNVSRYRNGDPIPQVTDPTQWEDLTTGAWCYYENNTANRTTYGKLYNWYAVNDPRGLSPVGYHIPSDNEWTLLTTSLGGQGVAGGKMKATISWNSFPGISNTNSSRFTGLSGGFRQYYGAFSSIGNYGYWWSSSEYSDGSVWIRGLLYDYGSVGRSYYDKQNGFSVRCLRD